jgi:hypothetical protein
MEIVEAETGDMATALHECKTAIPSEEAGPHFYVDHECSELLSCT